MEEDVLAEVDGLGKWESLRVVELPHTFSSLSSPQFSDTSVNLAAF